MRGRPRWELAVIAVASVVGFPLAAFFAAAIVGFVKLYRIPSSSMEPTLHCARPGPGCLARFSDRVLANRFIYHLHPAALALDHLEVDAHAVSGLERRQVRAQLALLEALDDAVHEKRPGPGRRKL